MQIKVIFILNLVDNNISSQLQLLWSSIEKKKMANQTIFLCAVKTLSSINTAPNSDYTDWAVHKTTELTEFQTKFLIRKST